MLSFDGKQAQLIRAVTDRQTRATNKTTLGTADLALESGRWYRVHVRAAGRQVQAFVDDKAGVRRQDRGRRRTPDRRS